MQTERYQNRKISIIIPAFNSEKHVGRCIESVINQEYKNLEIILVNDGSIDSTLSIFHKYELGDKRIKVISKDNGGLSTARNIGIDNATGEFILHVDSDDWIESDTCSLLLQTMDEEADIVICDMVMELGVKNKVRREPYKVVNNYTDFMDLYTFRSGLNSVCNKLIRRKLYTDNGIYHYTDISMGEDATALLRLCLCAKKIKYIASPLYHYSMNTGGMSQGYKQGIMQYKIGIDYVEKFYTERGQSIDLFPFIRLKVLYSELARIPDKKTKLYYEYEEVYKLFKAELPFIVRNKLFSKLHIKYKLFCWFNLFFNMY